MSDEEAEERVSASTLPEGEGAEEPLSQGALLPRVQQLLTRIFEPEERKRFEGFFIGAAAAIEGLGGLDLTQAEQDANWGDDGLVLEKLPPDLLKALDRVDRFLDFVQEAFPTDDDGDDDDFDFDLGPHDNSNAESGDESANHTESNLAQSLSAFSQNLKHEQRVLRDSFNAPVAETDPWTVFERVGEFRGRTRSGIGEMFFLAAREFAVVRKEDVVPFYKEDVHTSLVLRQAITHLRARIDLYRSRLEDQLQKDDPEGIRAAVSGLHDLFDAFMQTDAYVSLRVVDRRSCIDLRQSLAQLISEEKPPRRQVETAVDGLAKFLDSLTLVNQRELLVIHDREAIADTEPHLESIEEAVATDDPAAAREALRRALRTARPLFGREPTFDVLLNLLEHVDFEALSLDDLLALARIMGRQL